MRSWANWTAKTVVVVTGFAVAGGGLAGTAFAGTGTVSATLSPFRAGNISAASDNQISVPVSIPVDVCGNAAAVLGVATASCEGGALVAAGKPDPAGSGPAGGRQVGNISIGSGADTAGGPQIGNISAASGNDVQIPVEVAVNACGNAIGKATARCRGGAKVPGDPAAVGQAYRAGKASHRGGLTARNISVGSGNEVNIPVSVPANVCGNAASVLGDSSAGCQGGATVGAKDARLIRPLASDRTTAKPARKAAPHAKKARKSAHKEVARKTAGRAKHSSAKPSPDKLAGLGALSAIANLPAVADLPLLQDVTLSRVTSQLPATQLPATQLPTTSLAAMRISAPGQGMSGDSLAILAVGALLAGAASLKVAGRGIRSRKSRNGEASA